MEEKAKVREGGKNEIFPRRAVLGADMSIQGVAATDFRGVNEVLERKTVVRVGMVPCTWESEAMAGDRG